MSKVVIQGNASGTGNFTIAAPNSNTDRTLTLPDEAGTVITSSSSIPSSQLTGDAVPIGVNQTWTNVTSSRVLGTTYTNTTSQPILVNIVAYRSNAAGTIGITVDGLLTAQQNIAQNVHGFSSAIVPPSSTYSVSNSTLTTIVSWFELR